MRVLLKTMVLLATGACSIERPAVAPSFVYENFLGEGRPEYKITGTQIKLLDLPNRESSLAGTESISGEQVLAFDDVVTKVIKTGEIQISGDLTVQTRNFGAIQKLTKEMYYDESIAWVERTLTATDQPTLLMWMSEGNCLIKIKQTVNESRDCPTDSGNPWQLLNPPETESWIKIELNHSKGWVEVDDRQIREVDRNF